MISKLKSTHQWSVLALCRTFGIKKEAYYRSLKSLKQKEERFKEDSILVERAYKDETSYGARRLKEVIKVKDNVILSKERIGNIMLKIGLYSNYTRPKARKVIAKCDGTSVSNLSKKYLTPDVSNHHLRLLVSDTTYITTKDKTLFVCFILDVYSREIIGYSVGPDKNAELVLEAMNSIVYDLSNTAVFHSDQGVEYNNKLVKSFLCKRNIEQSFSRKGTPSDNAYSEALMKTFKIERCNEEVRLSIRYLSDLKNIVSKFVYWYNMVRLHSSLNYMSPRAFLLQARI